MAGDDYSNSNWHFIIFRRKRNMARQFNTVDYRASLNQTITIGDCLPDEHLARFIVNIIAKLDLNAIYSQYSNRGGKPIAPEILLGLIFYGYATGVFSSRKIEKATYESIPFRFIAGGMHPDHDTIAYFRKRFLEQMKDIFVQILLYAKEVGILSIGNISLDGSKVHADASKHSAVSYKRLIEIQEELTKEVEELFALASIAEQGDLPEAMDVDYEIALRQKRLTDLAQAKKVLAERAQERYEAEYADYEANLSKREEKARETGRKPRGKAPQPPIAGPKDKDQYNFTDPESRIMKDSNGSGFNQHYNVQIAVDQDKLLIVANTVTDHTNDQAEAIPTIDVISPEVGKPNAGAFDNGYFSKSNISQLEERNIDPYIATGREIHHKSWKDFFEQTPEEPPQNASPIVKMAYKLKTDIGKAIYKLRKCTVEPVIGVIKEVLGFRQFSLRGLKAVFGEWNLVCLAFNLKRLHKLLSPGL